MRRPKKLRELLRENRREVGDYGSIPIPIRIDTDSDSLTETEPPEAKPLSKKVKILTCAAIFYGNIGLALVCHVHGPALTSFQRKFQTDDKTISVVFSLMTAGISSGALLSGFVFRFVNRQLATVFVFGATGICMFAIPFCPDLTTFFVISTLMGFFGGFYSSAQFTWILEMMQSECPPYVIAEHFFYALGIIVSSLLLAPFLSKEDGRVGILVEDGNCNSSSLALTSELDVGLESRMIIPFAIMAVILELAMVFQLVLFIFFPYYAPPSEEENIAKVNLNSSGNTTNISVGYESISEDSITEENPGWRPRMKRLLLITYLGVFCGSFKGMEDNVVAFLPKFAQNGPLHLSESKSAYLLSASMLSYTVSRFCGIFVVYKVPPRGLLLFNMALTIFCNILLTTVAQDNEMILWITSILFGIGFSTAYGCFSSYLERYLRVTDAVGAFVLVFGAGIAALYPVLIGAYIENFPVILGYTAWISIGICSIVLVFSGIQTRYDQNRY